MNRRLVKLGAGLAMVALLAASCGDDDDEPALAGEQATAEAETGHAEDHAGEDDPASTAADLRAALTSLLQEHVYLAGAAIAAGVQAGGDLEAPRPASAVETLDANSVALADAVAGVYGEDAGDQFLELWRNHIGFFVDYTLGGATGDEARQDEARQQLADYRQDFGAFVESATGGNLMASTVADNLQVHVDTVIVAIDAVVAGQPDVYQKLQAAAHHMPTTAAALAGAIAEQKPEQFEGDASSPRAELRAGLTHLLQEHVYMAGLAINQAVADGGDLEAPTTANAVAALDENSVALSEAIGSVYGEDAAAQFLELWRNHIGFFVDYTLGGATGDEARQDEARQRLADYRQDFGAFVESATDGNLSSGTVAQNLQVHVDTLIEAIDAVLAGSPDVYPELREAARHMPTTAAALAGAIAEQFPERFDR